MRQQALPSLYNLDVKTLRLFDSVVAAKSLTVAAKANHLVVAAASRRISNFEKLVGAQLLVRGSRGLSLTPTGELVAEAVRNILETFNELSGIAHNINMGITDHIRLVANGVGVTEYLPRAIMAFREDHPEVMIEVEEMLSSDVPGALLQGKANIGLTTGSVEVRGLKFFKFGSEPLVLIAPDGHPLARRRSVSFADTLDYAYIGLRPGSMLHQVLRELARQSDKKLRVLAQVSGIYNACAMVRAGLGLAIVPRSAALSLCKSFGLKLVKLEGEHLILTEKVLHVDERKMSATERKLLQQLRNYKNVWPEAPSSVRTGKRIRMQIAA